MKYNETNKSIIFEKPEVNIIGLAIIELGGPFHSPFSKHLQVHHYADYDEIKKELDSNSEVDLNHLHLLIDIIQVLLVETLDSDWGTLYEEISKEEVEKLLLGLIEIYSNQVKKY